MNAGLERAVAQRVGVDERQAPADSPWPSLPDDRLEWSDSEATPAEDGRPLLAGVLILLTLGWFGACAYAFYAGAQETSLLALLSWIATISVPPALLALVWLIFGRTQRLETERFTRAVQEMRVESDKLDQVLGIVAERLSSNRAMLGEEAARLMKLGDEASDRLGRVTHYLSREGSELDRRSQALELAAGQARVDLGVLLADLPQAESVARTFSETLREAGMSAHERARALEAQLSAIAARAADADAATGGAAERLSAHIARIDSSATVATERLEGAAARLDAAVDAALGRTSEAVEASRAALDAQAEGLFAAVEQGRARFTDAGADAGRQLAAQLDEAGSVIELLSGRLAAQEAASQLLVQSLHREISGLDEQLAALGARSDTQATQLATALAGLRDATTALRGEIDASTHEAVALVGRTQEVGGALAAVARQLNDDLPPAFAGVEAQAGAARDAATALIAPVELAGSSVLATATRLADAEASVERQRQALEALIARTAEGVTGIAAQLGGLTAETNKADDAASLLVKETGPELIEALIRVREAARVAAGHARDAITAVIPDSAEQLAAAIKTAVEGAVANTLHEQVSEFEAASQRAATVGRKATERLTRQLLTLGESAGALEERIEQERALREEQDRGGMARRVALLVESLNSTAIDVTKILSNEVTDGAWSAYLKGDRGVFTRRAVRLLDSGEAREIARHYDEEPEFREQVNRYISDFETMLRRVLADRDSDALSVTLLSSDMGKLYVALAQAIERLRR